MANGTQAVRLTALERDGAVQDHRLQTIEEDVKSLTTAVDELRKTILAFAFTVAGSAVLIAGTLAFISKP